MADAQLIISRSGASSVADISVIGRPSILIPFAAATADHQTANARGLVDVGAAVLIRESALDPASLSEQILAILTTPGGLYRYDIGDRFRCVAVECGCARLAFEGRAGALLWSVSTADGARKAQYRLDAPPAFASPSGGVAVNAPDAPSKWALIPDWSQRT